MDVVNDIYSLGLLCNELLMPSFCNALQSRQTRSSCLNMVIQKELIKLSSLLQTSSVTGVVVFTLYLRKIL
jgi:hypothetical protein